MIGEIKGQNGKIMIFEEYLIISKSTIGGFISQGGASGERRYFYCDIVSVEYKKPTFFSNGYIKAIISGTTETNAKVGILGSSASSMKDQNTVVLRAFSSKASNEADKLHSTIMEKIHKAKTSAKSQPITVNSKLDELKKLGELKASGVLTEEEFQIEKEKLLNS